METSPVPALMIAWLWPIPWVGFVLALALIALGMRRVAATLAAVGLAAGVSLLIALALLVFSNESPSEGALWPTLGLILLPTAGAAGATVWLRLSRPKT